MALVLLLVNKGVNAFPKNFKQKYLRGRFRKYGIRLVGLAEVQHLRIRPAIASTKYIFGSDQGTDGKGFRNHGKDAFRSAAIQHLLIIILQMNRFTFFRKGR